eukprot:tig00001021_g6299.t1
MLRPRASAGGRAARLRTSGAAILGLLIALAACELAGAAKPKRAKSAAAGPASSAGKAAAPAAQRPSKFVCKTEKRASDVRAEDLTEAGLKLHGQQRFADALPCFEESAALAPADPVRWYQVGAIHMELQNPGKAIPSYLRAIELHPQFPEALRMVARAFDQSGQPAKAVEYYRKAIAVQPGNFAFYNDMAIASENMGNWADAAEGYRKATELNKDFDAGYYNLGLILQRMRKVKEAEESYRKAIGMNPGAANYRKSLADTLDDLGRASEALVEYREAVRRDPLFTDAFFNYGLLLSRFVPAEQARPRQGQHELDRFFRGYAKAVQAKRGGAPHDAEVPFADFHYVKYLLGYWNGRAESDADLFAALERALDEGRAPPVGPFASLAYALRPDLWRRVADAAARKVVAGLPEKPLPPGRPGAVPPLKVAYLSGDLGEHPVGHLIRGLPAAHNRSIAVPLVYDFDAPARSPTRDVIRSTAHAYVDASAMSSPACARRIRQDGVHVLIDLTGHTEKNRMEVLAMRPAPIQAHMLGHPGPIGAALVDYYIGDRVASTPETSPSHSERLIVMPFTHQVNDHREMIPEVGDPPAAFTRAAFQLPPDRFVFVNFNNLYKTDPATFEVWLNVLRRVPRSVLWRRRDTEALNLREVQAGGISEGRIVFAGISVKKDFVLRATLADAQLDNPVYNSHSTGTDLLWAGLPAVTVPLLATASSRGMAGFAAALGLGPEMAVRSLKEYEDAAVRWGSDPAWRPRRGRPDPAPVPEPEPAPGSHGALRRALEERRGRAALFDTGRWARDAERALSMAWDLHGAGVPPHHVLPRVDGGPLPDSIPQQG